MTYADDLHEPNDREPGEPEQEPPLDLDEVEAAHEQALIEIDESWTVGDENTEQVIRHVMPRVVAELREARQRIAEWEALETREEFALTGGREHLPNPAHPIVPGGTAELALGYARRHKAQAWVRRLTLSPWESLDEEPPF